VERCSKWWRFAEIPTAFGLPLFGLPLEAGHLR
jgi:hypothetical protein